MPRMCDGAREHVSVSPPAGPGGLGAGRVRQDHINWSVQTFTLRRAGRRTTGDTETRIHTYTPMHVGINGLILKPTSYSYNTPQRLGPLGPRVYPGDPRDRGD